MTGTSRRYRPGTLVLETEFETADGAVRVTDFMPRRAGRAPQLVRRHDYGSLVPWTEPAVDGALVQSGPDAFHLSTPLQLAVDRNATTADFAAVEGAREHFALSWSRSYTEQPPVEDADSALARTDAFWREWSGRCSYEGENRDEVLTSLIALKVMTEETTGAVVAAPTTSLPEDLGGVRNWDYRSCWLRDSVLTLNALLTGGYTDEALAFRDYVMRIATGDPAKAQIMYGGVGGERRLDEFELDWLPGYEGSGPVRVGNAAAGQFQLDVYGEVVGVAYVTAEKLGRVDTRDWPRSRALIEHVERIWREPDDGIWEARGPRRHYTHSNGDGVAHVRPCDQACPSASTSTPRSIGGDRSARRSTTKCASRASTPSAAPSPRSTAPGSSMQPRSRSALVGFLPGTDPRIIGTIDAVRDGLGHDGSISRYSTAETDDGLPGTEGQFLACSFWLVRALAGSGRLDEARELFARLLGLTNDLGLLAEEYDVARQRQVGNFPQAFSHLALIDAAATLTESAAPAR